MGCGVSNQDRPKQGLTTSLTPNTRIAKDCTLAPALIIMPRLIVFILNFEAGVVGLVGRTGPGDTIKFL
jgi:hypothetical protein